MKIDNKIEKYIGEAPDYEAMGKAFQKKRAAEKPTRLKGFQKTIDNEIKNAAKILAEIKKLKMSPKALLQEADKLAKSARVISKNAGMIWNEIRRPGE